MKHEFEEKLTKAMKSVTTTTKSKVTKKDWESINCCCQGATVERIEWAVGRFIYRCNQCRKTRAMESDGKVIFKK